MNKHQNIIHRRDIGCHPDFYQHEPMDRVELRSTMRRMGCYGHQDLADLIGVSRSTVTLWLQGKTSIPKPVAMLLRMMVEKGRAKTRT